MARMVQLLLVLVLLLEFTALAEQVPDVFVKEEDDAILTCDRVQDGQDKCDRTSWLYSDTKTSDPAAEIIRLGQITPGYSNKSDRLTVTETCSLVFKKVQINEPGRYSCQQFDQSGRQVSDAPVLLSVVSLREIKDSSEVKLNCQVFSPHRCLTLPLKWIYNNTEFKSNHPSIIKKEYLCGLSFSFRPAYYLALRTELFTCEVSHKNKKHQFKLSPEQPEETTTKNSNETGVNSSSLPAWWWAVLVAVAVAAVTITAVVVLLFRRRSNRMKPREVINQEPATEPEEAVSYASVTYTKKNKAGAEPRASEEDSVTYSSVRTPAPEDLNQLYASVH